MKGKVMHKFVELLHREVVPAQGCTEPIAVAYAVSIAAEQLESPAEHIELYLSGNIVKNALGVGIPGTGRIGIDIAALLGAPRMRHDITAGYKGENYRSYESLIPTLAQAVREVADYAASKGVMTMTENHGFFSQDSDRVEKLYMAVDHPNFGLLCDLGNFLCADENPAEAVARIAPYTRYVHGKDFIVKPFYSEDPGEGAFRSRGGNFLRGTIIGHGNVPVKHCLHLLKAAGFDGTISIEFEGMEPCVDAVRIGLANLKKYWSEV